MLIPIKPDFLLYCHFFSKTEDFFIDKLIRKIKKSSIKNYGQITKLSDSDLLIPIKSELDQLVIKSIRLCKKEFVSANLDFCISYFQTASSLDTCLQRANILKEYNIKIGLDFYHFTQLDNPNLFNFRFIGSFEIDNESDPIAIFDFFEGDSKYLKKSKLDTKSAFEDSVFNFYSNRIPQAIAGFNNILEIFPEDKASIIYISRCEKLLENNQF